MKLASRAQCLALALVLSFSSTSALAQRSLTSEVQFYPLHVSGQLVGCQVGFSVIRYDDEFGGGRPVVVNGLILFQASERGGAMLRLGVAPAQPPLDFISPERGYLVAGMITNVQDAGQSYQSDTPGFRAFPFALGESTTEAIGLSLTTGLFVVAYGMPGTNIEARFPVELAASPGVFEQWFECVGHVVNQ